MVACQRLDDRLRAPAPARAGRGARAAGVERVIDVRYRPQSRRPGHVARRGSASCSAPTGSPTSTARRSAPRPTCATTSTPAGSSRPAPATASTSRRPRPEALDALADELEHGPRTALLCLEEEPAGCHRRVLTELLRERLPALGRRSLVVQQEAGGVEHAPLAQAVQPRLGLAVGLPRGDGRGVAEAAQAVRSGSSIAWRSHARSSEIRRGRSRAVRRPGVLPPAPLGHAGGRVSATPRAPIQSGRS